METWVFTLIIGVCRNQLRPRFPHRLWTVETCWDLVVHYDWMSWWRPGSGDLGVNLIKTRRPCDQCKHITKTENGMIKHKKTWLMETVWFASRTFNHLHLPAISVVEHSLVSKEKKSSRKYVPAWNHSSENNGRGLSQANINCTDSRMGSWGQTYIFEAKIDKINDFINIGLNGKNWSWP